MSSPSSEEDSDSVHIKEEESVADVVSAVKNLALKVPHSRTSNKIYLTLLQDEI